MKKLLLLNIALTVVLMVYVFIFVPPHIGKTEPTPTLTDTPLWVDLRYTSTPTCTLTRIHTATTTCTLTPVHTPTLTWTPEPTPMPVPTQMPRATTARCPCGICGITRGDAVCCPCPTATPTWTPAPPPATCCPRGGRPGRPGTCFSCPPTATPTSATAQP